MSNRHYYVGREAGKYHTPASENPYAPNTRAHAEWERGRAEIAKARGYEKQLEKGNE